MRLLVIGASGRTGQEVVRQALGHGHSVRAFVRTPPASPDPRVEYVTGDVLDFDAVEGAVHGRSAVAFCVGAGTTRPVDVHSEGIANVIHAMAVCEVRALAAMSAVGAFARSDRRISMGFRLLIRTSLKPVYDDLERMEQRIAASDLDWTIVRPAGLTDAPPSGHYRFTLDGSLLSKGKTVSRADVAGFMLKALETGAFIRRTIVIAD